MVEAGEERRFDDAVAYYRKSLKLKLRHGGRDIAASTFLQLGSVAQKQRRLRPAMQYLRKSLQLALEHGERHGAALAYRPLGNVALEVGIAYRQLGNAALELAWFEEAAACFHESLEIFLEFDDWRGAASAHHDLGRLADVQDQFGEAASSYRQSLDLNLRYGDRHGAAITYGQLGNLMFRTGRHAEALDYYLNALPILGEAADGGHLVMATLRNLARLWRAWGDDVVITRTAEVTGQTPAEIRAFFEQVPPLDHTTP